MPIEYDAEQCNALFLPQLLLYFMRLLSLYDSALKGQSVESFTQSAPSQVERDSHPSSMSLVAMTDSPIEPMAMQVEDSLDEDTIKRAWSKAEIDPELAAHADDILDESDPDLVNVTVQASKPGGKELMMLRAAAQRANEELSNVWLGCREQFLAKWMGPGGDGAQAQPPVDPLERAAARLSALRRARTNVLGLAKGNYRSAMLYCPELSSKELCKEPSSSTQSSDVPPADDRQRSKSLEALLAPSFVELVSLVGSGNLRRNDRFLLFIKTKLSKMGKQDDFSVIAAMRHLVLTAYCFLVVAETMEIALDRVLMCIPGYSEGEIKATSRSAATRSPVPPTPVAAGAAGGPAAGTDIPDDIRAFSDDIFKNTPFVSTSNKARTRATPPANSRYAPASTLANNSSGRKCTFVRCGHREKDGQTFQVCGPCRRAGIQVPYCRYALGPLAAKRSPFVRSMYMRFDCSCVLLSPSPACSRECQTRDWKVSHKQQCVSQRASSSTAAASTTSDAASSPTQSAPVADSSAAAITAVEEQATERPAVDGPCDASQAVHTPAEASAEQQPPSSPSPSPQAAGAQSNNTSTPAQ